MSIVLLGKNGLIACIFVMYLSLCVLPQVGVARHKMVKASLGWHVLMLDLVVDAEVMAN